MPSKVDLPEPLRPTRQIRSPAAMARPAPDNSGAAPKVRAMSCSRSNGGTSRPLALCLEPNHREPGSPRSRQAKQPVVLVDATGHSHVVAPNFDSGQLDTETDVGRRMHEQHAGRAADGARAMAAAADIVSEKHFPAAASVLLPVAGFDLQYAGE